MNDALTNWRHVRSKCDISPYQISRMQIGQGASSMPEASSVVSLGGPLTSTQYGDALRSVGLTKARLYANEETNLGVQTFIELESQGVLGTSSLVSVVILDENTANGTELDEIGLFVDNPFLVTTTDMSVSPIEFNFGLLGQDPSDATDATTNMPDTSETPGHLLAAYRHFPKIKKESYFSLVFRWKINFSVPR